MDAKDKLEGYLINLGLTYEKITDDTWVINDSSQGLNEVMIMVEDPVAIVRVVVMTVPKANREVFFETILKLNANDLIYGAYGILGDQLILQNCLLLETLDLPELQSTLDEVGLALAEHYPVLSKYMK